MNKYDAKWDSFLDPEYLGICLKFVSLFIAIYENFKYTIIENVRYFYWSGYKNGVEYFNDYEEQVLKKVKSKKKQTTQINFALVRRSRGYYS